MEKSDMSPTAMRIPRGIPQGGDADAPKSGGGARGEPRESGIRTERNSTPPLRDFFPRKSISIVVL